MIASTSLFARIRSSRAFSTLRILPRIAAALRGATGRVALDDEHLALGRVVRLAVRELARQASAAEESLAATGDVAGLACGDPGGRGGLRLADDFLGPGRVFFEPVGELVLEDPLQGRLCLRVGGVGLRPAPRLRLG